MDLWHSGLARFKRSSVRPHLGVACWFSSVFFLPCKTFVCRCCCRSQGTSTSHNGEVSEAVRTPLPTKLSQNAAVDSPCSLPHQASATPDLQGPMPCDSPPAGPVRPRLEEEEWPRQSVELVTYELELDTGSCKVSTMQANAQHKVTKPGLVGHALLSFVRDNM